MEKYYLDTCIWIDYFEDRIDRFRPLGEWAFMLIRRLIDDGSVIIFSEVVRRELLKFYSEDKIKSLLSIVPGHLLVYINVSQKQWVEADELSKRFSLPLNDILHFIIARDNDAILISRDKHFYELMGELSIKKPEDLI